MVGRCHDYRVITVHNQTEVSMARSAVALSISTTTAERKLIEEYSYLTGENPTQLVRHLVFARLPHIVAALRELRIGCVDATTIPDFDLAP
jgi:hypothetical protein